LDGEIFFDRHQNKTKNMAQRSKSSAAALSAFLQHYRRISVDEACTKNLHQTDAELSIWVNQRGTWKQLSPHERKLKWTQFKAGRSVCQSIVRGLFGLSEAQYQKVHESFDDPAWKTWAGIYELDDDSFEGPTFAIVVELPDDSIGVAGGVAGGAGAAVGLTLGAGGALVAKYFYDRSKDGSAETPVSIASKPHGSKADEIQQQIKEITDSKEKNSLAHDEVTQLQHELITAKRNTQAVSESLDLSRAANAASERANNFTREDLERKVKLSDTQRATAESDLTKSRDKLQRVSDVLERNQLELQQKTTELATEKALRISAEPYKTKLQEAVRHWLLSRPNIFTAQKVFDDEREYLSNEWGLSQALLDDARDGTQHAFPTLIDRLENYIKLTGSSDYQGDIGTLHKDNYTQGEKINALFKKYTNAYYMKKFEEMIATLPKHERGAASAAESPRPLKNELQPEKKEDGRGAKSSTPMKKAPLHNDEYLKRELKQVANESGGIIKIIEALPNFERDLEAQKLRRQTALERARDASDRARINEEIDNTTMGYFVMKELQDEYEKNRWGLVQDLENGNEQAKVAVQNAINRHIRHLMRPFDPRLKNEWDSAERVAKQRSTAETNDVFLAKDKIQELDNMYITATEDYYRNFDTKLRELSRA
jgi:hypothetical protein